MSLTFSRKELFELMRDFHTLTGIRIVLFDDNCSEIFAYPEDCISFCACMRKIPEFYDACRKSDEASFAVCNKTKSYYIYKCHAGLIECTTPIVDNNTIIGYIMFGQVSDNRDRTQLYDMLNEVCNKYKCREDLSEEISRIRVKAQKHIAAASKILEACVSYILQKEMVKPSRTQMFITIDTYITEHLNEDLSIDALCDKFRLSRTRLYELMERYIDEGIATYIKKKRLYKAKELLQTTDMSVDEICLKVGFSDYNYFLRTFKSYYGASTKAVRNKR